MMKLIIMTAMTSPLHAAATELCILNCGKAIFITLIFFAFTCIKNTLCGSLQWQHLAALTGIEQHCSIAPQKDVCNNAFRSVNARGKKCSTSVNRCWSKSFMAFVGVMPLQQSDVTFITSIGLSYLCLLKLKTNMCGAPSELQWWQPMKAFE